MATEGDWEGKVRYVKFVKMSEGAGGEKRRRRGARALTWKNDVHIDIDCCAIQNCATCQHGIVSRTMDGLRTYAAPVEHQVPGASVAQAPEDGERATACYGGVRVGEPRWHAREHGVVRRGRPETCIRLRLRRLPERARVGDPVREEEACWASVPQSSADWSARVRGQDAPRRKEVAQMTTLIRRPAMVGEEGTWRRERCGPQEMRPALKRRVSPAGRAMLVIKPCQTWT